MRLLLLFIPFFGYIGLFFLNPDIFLASYDINFFGFILPMIPFLMWNTACILGYILIVFFLYGGINVLLRYKNKNLENQIIMLKSELYDGQSALLQSLQEHFDQSIGKSSEQNNRNFAKVIQFNEYTLERMIIGHNTEYEAYKKETQKLLDKLGHTEGNFLDKIKKW